MSAAEAFYREMVSFGLSVEARDGTLYVSPTDQITDALRAKIREHKPELLRLLSRPSWRWLVTNADGTVIDHTVTPHATEPEMRAAYPGAVGFEPVCQRFRRFGPTRRFARR
ncbi:MAG: hypothetical protein EOM22_10435 [Gammaproteobacteria bacterium]|jgi:hypothetical protein|nr:hypothetical protein [Gammaproteobacteria bacterium]